MNYLIQNTTQAPVRFSVVKMKEGKPSPEGSIFFEGGNQITNVSEEIYEQIIRHPFYKQKIEKGELIVLNASSSQAESMINSAIQSKELAYGKYVAFVKQVEASGGLSEPRLKPYLDAEGMPKIELCRKNLGDNIDPQTIEEYRGRYILEKANGLHENKIVIPGGGSMSAGAQEIDISREAPKAAPAVPQENIEERLKTMSMEELKQKADELNVSYTEEMSFNRLLNRVRKAIGEKE